MKSALKTAFAAALLAGSAAQVAPAADGFDREATLIDYQAAMINYIELVGSKDLQQRFNALTQEDWEFLYQATPDRGEFIEATVTMQSLAGSDGRIERPLPAMQKYSATVQSAVAPSTLFAPAYPSGGNYNTWTATMPGLGLLIDSPDIGTETGTALNDERCDANAEAGTLIALSTLSAVAIAADTVCNSTPSPFEPAACIPAGVANAAVLATEIVLWQCGYQTALVDSAEIEAAFENTVQLIGTVNHVDVMIHDETNFTDDSELAVHDDDIKTGLATHDTDVKTAVLVHDTDIKSGLATHDAEIKSAVLIHDTDIKSALATHDSDVKALLANVQAGVNANGARLDLLLERQLEVVRLLHTPQGMRSTDIPACEGGPCSWNR